MLTRYQDETGSWRPPKTLGRAVEFLIRDIKPLRKTLECVLLEAVVRAAGEEAAGHLRVAGVKAGMVTIEADSAGFVQELEFKKRKILESVKADPACGRVVGVKFKTGKWH